MNPITLRPLTAKQRSWTAAKVVLTLSLLYVAGTSMPVAQGKTKKAPPTQQSVAPKPQAKLPQRPDTTAKTVAPKSEAAAVSHQREKLNLKSLDLTKPPSEADIRRAGQLGSPLSPSRAADPAKIKNAAARKKQEEDNKALGRAIQKWNEHKYPEAAALFRQHRQTFADSPWAGEAELHLGCNAQFSGSWDEARASFEWILTNTPKGSDIYQKAKLRRAILHFTQGQLEEAGQTFTELLKGETDWERRNYAQYWIQQMGIYRGHQVALRACGRDSIACVLDSKGEKAKANALRGTVAPSERGYSIGELVALGKSSGLDATAVRASTLELAGLPTPFVAHYSDEHFVVIREVTSSGAVKLFDPRLQHDCLLTGEQFAAQWSGLAVVFSAPPAGIRLASQGELTQVMGGCCGLPLYPSQLGPKWKDDCLHRGLPGWQVNPVNMNLVVSDVPLWYESPIGPAIELELTYNSQDSLNQIRPFGNKWLFNYASYAMESPNSTLPAGSVLIVMPTGRGDVYQPLTASEYSSPPGAFTKLTKIADYTYDLLLPDGMTYHYGIPAAMQHPISSGGLGGTSSLLLSMEDRNHNLVAIGHNEQGEIISITDAQNNKITFAYNAEGLIKSARDEFGRTATFGYDASRNLINQKDMGGLTYSYTYDENVYLTSITTPTGTTLFYIEPANDALSNGADEYPVPGGLMWSNYRLTVTDPLGYKEEYYYSGFLAAGWHRDKKQYLSPLPPQDYEAPKTTYYFDLLGTPPNSEGAIWMIERADRTRTYFNDFTADTRQPQSITDGNWNVTQFTYNPQGNVVTRTDPRNVAPANEYVTTYTYAENGLDLLKVTDFFHDDDHPALAIEYDERRNVKSVRDGLGRGSTTIYNEFGQPDTVTDATGQTRKHHYNTRHELTSITQNGNVLSSIIPDPVGRPETVTDQNGYSLHFTYDDLNRNLRVTYPDGTYTENYWACCVLDAKRDRSGNLTIFGYNPSKRLAYTVDPAQRVTQYYHDPAGNLTDLVDANGNRTHWEYDTENRIAKKSYADDSSYTYQYDGAGNLKYRTDAKQLVTTYDYDAANNLIGISAPGLFPIGFSYDQLGRRIGMTDETGTTTYGYNLANELTTTDGPWENDTITLSYDALGRATGRSINNAGANILVFDDYGRPQTVTNPLGAFTYTYPTPISTVVESITASAGPSTNFSYYAATGDQRLKEMWHKSGAGETISRFDYEYDVLGSIRKWTQQAGTTPAQAFTFDYDPARQLNSAVLADANGAALKSYSYDYDRGGNRIGEAIDLGVTKEVPNHLNQLTTRQGGTGVLPIRGRTDEPALVTVNGKSAATNADNSFEARIEVVAGSNPVTIVATDAKGNATTNHYDIVATGSGNVSLTYDLNGNLTGDGTRTFEWDPLDRLTAITNGSHRSEFTYNGAGQRVIIVEKDDGAVTSTKRLISVGVEIAEERDPNNNVSKRYYAQGEERSGGDGSLMSYYYTRDHLGSIRELTDAGGVLHVRYDYDPYGRRTKVSGDMDADFGFTGHYYHTASGVHLALSRGYDAEVGRWLNRDPIREKGGINVYGYVQNSPVNRVDPLGLYGYETKFWADLSVNGNWAQRAIAWPLGVIATILTPDTIGISGTGSLGYIGGGTAGVDRQWFRGDDCPNDFTLAGDTFDHDPTWDGAPDFMSPQLSASFQINLGWSTDYNPNGSTWAGNFREINASAGPYTGTYFEGGSWRGVGLGVTAGPVPVSVSNLNVNYQPYSGKP
jgi:RHS repeat-associated protein